MNKHVILLSAAAMLLFSCSREADQVIQPGETITFTAAWAGADETRTILQSDGTSVWWDAAEQINVFFSDKASGKFTSTNSQPQAIVDFQGSLPIVVGSVETENPPHAYWAVYPYDAANTCDGVSVTLSVPATQTAKEGTFADKMFPSIATSTNFYLAFYNVCGGVRFTVANEGISSVTFKANNGESLAGKVKVGFNGTPVIKSVIEGASEVVVNAPTGGFVPGKYYFATLLPQTLSKGVSLIFKKSDGKVASTSLENSITINRGRFGKMEEKDKGLEFKDDGSGHQPTDAIVFADTKVKEKLVAAFDANSDGELSYEEAAAVTSGDNLKAAFGAIKTYKSFDEFQYFTGITELVYSMFEGWTITSIVLPSSLTGIDKTAFKGCARLVSISIPEGVTALNEGAFQDCSLLSSILLPETVTYLGKNVFSGCASLSSITIPENVYQIGESSFYNCSSLESIVLPKNISKIAKYSFYGCTSLASLVFSESIQHIEDYAFTSCTSIQSVTLPQGLMRIGEGAFYNCESLTSVFIPEGVNRIGEKAFMLCTSLKTISLPEGITSIEPNLFNGCAVLSNIEIPESVTNIGYSAFLNCTSLESVIIPDSVSSIENSVFYGCSSLSSMTIPENVVSIGESVFYQCVNLNSLRVAEGNPIFDSRENCNAIIRTDDNTLIYGCKGTIIPDTVSCIGRAAFEYCTLSHINIPNSVTKINAFAFYYCTSLLEIVIPKSVTVIETEAFEYCTSMVSITILSDTPPTGQRGMFSATNNAPIYVPSGSVDAYKSAEYWSDYASRIQAIQE